MENIKKILPFWLYFERFWADAVFLVIFVCFSDFNAISFSTIFDGFGEIIPVFWVPKKIIENYKTYQNRLLTHV